MKKLLAMMFLLSIALLSKQTVAGTVLVDTSWLASKMNDKNIVIVDTSDQTQYMRFHIPGAIHIDYNEIVYQPRGQKFSIQVPNDYLLKLLGQKGIKNTDYIVIYDDIGGMNAGRLFWQLEQIGHEKISVVNGGLVKWILEKREVTNKPTVRAQAVYKTNQNSRDNLATLSQLKNSKAMLIDARSKEEFIGYPRYPRTGHIPGAHNWDWQDNVDFENAFVIKPETSIKQQQQKINLENKDQEVIAYCRSGHRAAQTYLTLRSMGFNKIRLYDGSMAEYEQHKELPLEKGCTGC